MMHFSKCLSFSSFIGMVCLMPSMPLAQSTVSASDRYSWTPDIGWVDWRAGGAVSGAKFANKTFASGFIYSPNIGWMNLGDGTPANGVAYANTSGGDFGVNVNATANLAYYYLSGLAWGGNVGWVSFDITDPAYRPKIEKATGDLSGYAWGENIGWLRLDAPGLVVKTGLINHTSVETSWVLYP